MVIGYVKRYIELGFVVHPCCPASHKCQSPGKIPFDPIAGKHMAQWQEHKQFSLAQWQEWCDYDSELNIGFLCGSPSALVGIDIDSDEGQVILERSEIRGWDETWRYSTGRGHRYLFRVSKDVASYKLPGDDSFIEILGDGRQSVLPPSEHPSGRRYKWCAGYSPRDRDIVSAGDWASGTGGGAGGHGSVEITSDKEDWAKLIENGVKQGERNETLTRIAGHLMNPAPATASETFMWLSMFNRLQCDPPLSHREVETIVRSIGRREAAAEVVKKREIRAIAKRHQVSLAEAEVVWRSS